MSRELMIRAIAYRVQEERFGGLASAIRARLLAAPPTNGKPPPIRKNRIVKPGTSACRRSASPLTSPIAHRTSWTPPRTSRF